MARRIFPKKKHIKKFFKTKVKLPYRFKQLKKAINLRRQYNNLCFYIAYKQKGADGLIDKVSSRYKGNNRRISNCLWKASRLVKRKGNRNDGMVLAEAAVKFHSSYKAMKEKYNSLVAIDLYEEAAALLDVIEKKHSDKLKVKYRYRKDLDRLKTLPPYSMRPVSLIEENKPRQIEFAKNRICYVLHNSLPYSSGGYATRALGMMQGWKENGYEVIAVTRPGFPWDTKPELLDKELPITENLDGFEYIRISKPLKEEKNYIVKAAAEFEKAFRAAKPEIVVAASAYFSALPALIAAKRLGIPFVYEVRGFWEITKASRKPPKFRESQYYKVYSALEAKIANCAEHVFTLTEPMREELVSRGVPFENITLLPNSCEPERFLPKSRNLELAARLGIPNNVMVIGYIGTFVDYEGLEDLTSACAELKKAGKEFRLMLVGNENTSGQEEGTITKKIRQVAKDSEITDWLIMPGRVPHHEVEDYYSLIDIAPFPRKPWPVCEIVSPMKPLEALAMEKAVLVSSNRALTEMIQDGKTGMVYEKGSTQSLMLALKKLIENPSLRDQLGKDGRQWVINNRRWVYNGKRFKDVLDSILGGETKTKKSA